MSKNLQHIMLKRILLKNGRSSRLWASMLALLIGNTLLLLSVLIWWNFNELLYGKDQNDSLGSTFITVGKKVTNANMGNQTATLFTVNDIDSVVQAVQVQSVGMITSNQFPVFAMMGGDLAFATELPLESVPDSFLEHKPEDWQWQPGSRDLPIIMSSQFLDIYNYVFAPSQGLPQLSESSVKLLALNLKVGPGEGGEVYTAHVVGFSDRISSVMAPQSFIDYGNSKYGKQKNGGVSQLILKVKDPSDIKFSKFLQRNNLTTNSQSLRWSKIRSIVEVVTTATGVLAVLLMGIGILVFILFVELTIANAKGSLILLIEIGYSPRMLSRFMIGRFIPLIIGVLATGMLIALAAQIIATHAAAAQGLVLHTVPGIPFWLALFGSAIVLLLLVVRSIGNAINKN